VFVPQLKDATDVPLGELCAVLLEVLFLCLVVSGRSKNARLISSGAVEKLDGLFDFWTVISLQAVVAHLVVERAPVDAENVCRAGDIESSLV
jgi:hypothetical protein